jgi:hypothetical protein
LFSLVLLGGLFLFEMQLRTLRQELNQHIAVHQTSVQVARDMRYLSLERLAMAMQRAPDDLDQVMEALSVSERRTEGLITELADLLSHEAHERPLEGPDQGQGTLASYALAREALPELYRRWLTARAAEASDEPLRRLQLMQQFHVVEALLEDLTQYQEITQQLVVARTNARIEQTQLYF